MVLPIIPQKSFDYERVVDDEWVEGVIIDVQERVNDKKKYKEDGVEKFKTVDEVRLVFKLDGYKFNHYSRWSTKSVNKKANLFVKYLKELVPGLLPDKAIDLDALKNMKVKTMWKSNTLDNGVTYQSVAMVRPLETKNPEDIYMMVLEDDKEIKNKEELPF